MPSSRQPIFVLVGWDAADWQVLSPLLDAHALPHLRRLVEGGLMGDLSTVSPLEPDVVWSSLATGARAARHGILGANLAAPHDVCDRVAPVWKVLAAHGVAATAIGWPEALDAEAEPGAPDDLMVRSADLDADTLRFFVPGLADAVARRDPRIPVLAGAIAHAASIHNVATWVLARRRPRFLAVRYGALAAIHEWFMRYAPPRMPDVSAGDLAMYSGVVAAACRYHDMMLGRLIELAGDEAMVMVVSAHGFHSDHRRPVAVHPGAAPVAAQWRRRYGVFAAAGPGVPQDERVYGLSVLDIAPTVLAHFGVPRRVALEGRACRAMAGAPDEARDGDTAAAVPSADNLADAGVPRRWRLHAAIAELEAGRAESGRRILESLVAEDPTGVEARQRLARAALTLGDRAACAEHVSVLLAQAPAHVATRLLAARLAVLDRRAADAGEHLRAAEGEAAGRAPVLCEIGLAYASAGALADAERVLRLAIDADPGRARGHDALARVLLAAGRPADAADAALKAIAREHQSAEAHLHLGIALSLCGWSQRAATAFETCLGLDPDASTAHRWLAHLFSRSLADPARAAHHAAAASRLTAAS
jgi:tetratricopeptide (TPR) repeat protein